MTMLMMERIIATSHKSVPQTQELVADKERSLQSEPQIFLQPKRISDDSRDVEMCDKTTNSDDDEDLNVDVENDDTSSLCPVDLTRRQQETFTSFENLVPSNKTDSTNHSDYTSFKDDLKRAESVCSDVSRSDSPRDRSPSVVSHHQNRRLAFSVENILDPTKFTGRQTIYSDGICCWKPLDGSRGSPEYEGSDAGQFLDVGPKKILSFGTSLERDHFFRVFLQVVFCVLLPSLSLPYLFH